MPPKKNAAADAGDSSGEDEINVNKVVETKMELDKIRKERDKKRAQLQADLDKKLDNLRARIHQSVTAHTQQLGDIHRQNVNRLLPAIEARDTILQTIGDKLAEIQVAGEEIATYLDGAYEYRMKKAESYPMSAEVPTSHQDKNVKAGTA
ncbi:hypothetical protein VMCG_00913 [Cytospora schulzeri]|uniref:Uncharacterized protein n=1 Tax=Cytospora schulzeri TaxID=448051 RepID=A0A423X4R1_9PEZI|nr:hypothetical protein VMCG_00913 [Valsa malicola]